LKVRSAIVVPMRVPSRTIGAMSFLTSESRRRLTDADVALAEQLARRAAVAVENSRLHTQLAEVAETLQNSLLPSELPELPGWEVAALYRPAETDLRIDVGGDFYEVFEAHGGCLAVIGDVTGHGVAAATVTAAPKRAAATTTPTRTSAAHSHPLATPEARSASSSVTPTITVVSAVPMLPTRPPPGLPNPVSDSVTTVTPMSASNAPKRSSRWRRSSIRRAPR
jgi:hypothetical protein